MPENGWKGDRVLLQGTCLVSYAWAVASEDDVPGRSDCIDCATVFKVGVQDSGHICAYRELCEDCMNTSGNILLQPIHLQRCVSLWTLSSRHIVDGTSKKMQCITCTTAVPGNRSELKLFCIIEVIKLSGAMIEIGNITSRTL